jgi:hypothetical protein
LLGGFSVRETESARSETPPRVSLSDLAAEPAVDGFTKEHAEPRPRTSFVWPSVLVASRNRPDEASEVGAIEMRLSVSEDEWIRLYESA